MITTTGKSVYLYNTIFEDFKKKINNNINIEDIPNKIIIDFEKSLQKSIKTNFPNLVIDGCYFHYVKLLWGKAKKLGLCKKEELKNTKILLFVLIIIPFLKVDDKVDVFEKIEELFTNKDNGYRKMVAYFRKNWLNNNYINYNEISEDGYINRTNNYLEWFHGYLNDTLQCFHPKILYLISKYKLYLINIYENININLVNNDTKKTVEKFSIVADILKFIKNYNIKSKTKININIIFQSDENEKNIIKKIYNYI